MGNSKHSQLFEIRPDPLEVSNQKPIRVRVAAFTDVQNAAELKTLVEKGSLDCALIRAELVLELFQVLAAAQRAVACHSRDKMQTKNINLELLYSLSPSKNISESLSVFGISEESRHVIAVTLSDERGAKMSAVCKKLKGKAVPLDDIKDLGDYATVKQVYHVSDPDMNKGTIMDAILSRMVAKDYLA